jgi:prolyl 4-hydroxylase
MAAVPDFKSNYASEAKAYERSSSVLLKQTINGEDLQGEAQAAAAVSRQANVIDPNILLANEDPPELNPRTGVPLTLKQYLVHKDPEFYLIPNFVTDAEIEHLLALSEELWTPSVVGTGVYKTNDESKDLANKQSQNRTSFSCMLKSAQTPIVGSVEQRIAAVAGMEVEYLERLNLVRYTPGQFFNKHHDGRFRPKTVFIYLNDLPEGDDGETYFPELDLKFKPGKGVAIMWANTIDGKEDMRTVHHGLPPKTTMKYGVNCFFNIKPVKHAEAAEAAAMEDLPNYSTIDPQDLVEVGVEAVPKQIRAYTVRSDPKVTVVPKFLSPEECHALIAVLTGEPITVDDSIYGMIEQRCALLAGVPPSQMDPFSISVNFSDGSAVPDGVVFYNAQDGSYRKRFGIKTITLFLNDVSEGGELRFPRLSLEVLPREGTAVMWSILAEDGSEDMRAVHQGRSPKTEKRYIAICACRESAARE